MQLQATVASINTAARALYLEFGFRPYGFEPRALRVGARYYDQELLLLPLDEAPRPDPAD
jgi:RimJ/RimL family protein N-acetyltransferase